MAKREEWEIIVDALHADERAAQEREARENEKARRGMFLVRALDEYFRNPAIERWIGVQRIYRQLQKEGVV